MFLKYHTGQNFGDALNPIIWDHFLPNFFDQNEEIIFIGIGTLLGFEFPEKSRKIVFSTGATIDKKYGYYGSLPKLDPTWEIRCLRGPLTAKLLNVDKNLAVADGAILIKEIFQKNAKSKHDFSFIPHIESLPFLDFNYYCEGLELNFIDPRWPPNVIIDEILASKKIFCEAMHGAIVADALRVPWVPIKMFRQVNEFKWMDWMLSLNINDAEFTYLPEVYNKNFLKKISENKFKTKNPLFHKIVAKLYYTYQKEIRFRKTKEIFNNLKNHSGFLSNEKKLNQATERLLEHIEILKKEYWKPN